jgi:hypothetical protein
MWSLSSATQPSWALPSNSGLDSDEPPRRAETMNLSNRFPIRHNSKGGVSDLVACQEAGLPCGALAQKFRYSATVN